MLSSRTRCCSTFQDFALLFVAFHFPFHPCTQFAVFFIMYVRRFARESESGTLLVCFGAWRILPSYPGPSMSLLSRDGPYDTSTQLGRRRHRALVLGRKFFTVVPAKISGVLVPVPCCQCVGSFALCLYKLRVPQFHTALLLHVL